MEKISRTDLVLCGFFVGIYRKNRVPVMLFRKKTYKGGNEKENSGK